MTVSERLLSVVALALLFPDVAHAQSAIGQLETATKTNIQRFQPSHSRIPPVPPPTRVGPAPSAPKGPKAPSTSSVSGGVSGMLLEGIFSEALSSSSDSEEASRVAEQQRLEAERIEAERVRRTAVVQQQRAVRDRETADDMEAMRAAMSEPFDGNSFAAPPVVDLRGKKGIVPVAAEPVQAGVKTTTDNSAQTEAQRKLKNMAKENEKVAVLARRLKELEKELEQARKSALQLKRDFKGMAREYGAIEDDVTAATDRATERGISMAMGGLLSGNKQVLGRLGKVMKEDGAGREVVEHLNNVNDFVEFTEDLEKLKGDIDWVQAKRNLLGDLGYLAERLEIGGPYYEYGRSIIDSSIDVYRELSALRKSGQLDTEYAAAVRQQSTVDAKMKKLIDEVKRTRGDVAKLVGVDPKHLKRSVVDTPKGLGSPVPHPND